MTRWPPQNSKYHKYLVLYDDQAWPFAANEDLWIFDKLILSRKLGHLCGPAGVPVPRPGNYVVRPCVNLLGMSLGAKILFIESDTSHLAPGAFWQELFSGRHLSLDYLNGELIRCTEGFKSSSSLARFNRWLVVDDQPVIPQLLLPFVTRYQQVNIEMIDDRVIEVHLRGNPDFDDGAVEAIPIWDGVDIECPDGFRFVDQPDGDRIGFFKRY